MYLNKVQLIGNLTRDPEIKALPSGVKVLSFTVATNRTWKDQAGQKKDATEFHNVVAFGKIAELIAQYVKKGGSLYIEGRLQTRSWDAADGQKRYRTEILVENFQFGPRPTTGGPTTATYQSDKNYQDNNAGPMPQAEDIEMIEYPTEDSSADIPF